MIESLSLTNFYSFKETETISFIASKERNRYLDESYCGFSVMNRKNILKLAFLVGNNGAGKSKLFEGFRFLNYLIIGVRSKKEDSLECPTFRFDEECDDKPAGLGIIYHIENKRFQYNIEWTKDAIYTESLKELRPRSEIVLFERSYNDETNETIVDLKPAIEMSDDQQYLIKSALLPNNSVISLVGTTNLSHPILNAQAEFFSDGFQIIDLDEIDLESQIPDGSTEDGACLKKMITGFLQSIDSNIISYEKLPVDIKYPKVLLDKLKQMPEDRQNELREIIGMNKDHYVINTFHKIKGKSGKRTRLPLRSQSKGTLEIISLLLVINESIQKKKTIILDDFFSYVHRSTLEELITFFLGCKTESQIFFSTQDYSVFDHKLMRRDFVRILHKDEMGISHVSSLKLGELSKNTCLSHYLSCINEYEQLPVIRKHHLKEILDQYLMDLDRINNRL